VKRAVITGAGGFIGRHVLSPLSARGFEVVALSRSERALSEGTEWRAVDLLDAEATDRVFAQVQATHLLHLAWDTKPGEYWEAPENLDWVAASLRLLRSFRDHGGRRAVVAGTCAEYDWTEDCCDERTPLRPASLYGKSKNALRELFAAYARSSALSAAWGRVFFTYGPGERAERIVAAVARALDQETPIQCSHGLQVRDFLYVGDVAGAFASLLDGDAEGEFDIGSGRGIALRDLLLRLEERAGRSGIVRFGDAAEDRGPMKIVADPDRLRSELGWTPLTSLDEGLDRTLAWWRERGGAPEPQ